VSLLYHCAVSYENVMAVSIMDLYFLTFECILFTGPRKKGAIYEFLFLVSKTDI